ncbi:MAG: molybdopterin converting factor subunit 1 [Candidatus Binatia bacterium]
MRVKVRFFAALRERVGATEITKEIVEGSTVRDLWEALQHEYPKLAPVKMALLYAVNRDYVSPNRVLQDEDEVAFVPPVSGG